MPRQRIPRLLFPLCADSTVDCTPCTLRRLAAAPPRAVCVCVCAHIARPSAGTVIAHGFGEIDSCICMPRRTRCSSRQGTSDRGLLRSMHTPGISHEASVRRWVRFVSRRPPQKSGQRCVCTPCRIVERTHRGRIAARRAGLGPLAARHCTPARASRTVLTDGPRCELGLPHLTSSSRGLSHPVLRWSSAVAGCHQSRRVEANGSDRGCEAWLQSLQWASHCCSAAPARPVAAHGPSHAPTSPPYARNIIATAQPRDPAQADDASCPPTPLAPRASDRGLSSPAAILNARTDLLWALPAPARTDAAFPGRRRPSRTRA